MHFEAALGGAFELGEYASRRGDAIAPFECSLQKPIQPFELGCNIEMLFKMIEFDQFPGYVLENREASKRGSIYLIIEKHPGC